jgi:hypothetical protein
MIAEQFILSVPAIHFFNFYRDFILMPLKKQEWSWRCTY